MKPRAKLADVARRAGVSQGTASNAFNRPALVRPEVLARVATAARDLGYGGPDPKGRMLRSAKVNAIGIVPGSSLPTTFAWPYSYTFLAGVSEVCEDEHAGMVIVSGADLTAGTRSLTEALVDGFILHNPRHVDELTALVELRHLPFVLVDADAPAHVNAINVDSRAGARDAIRHLLALGHRRFAILSLAVPRNEPRRPLPILHKPARRQRRLVETFRDTRERYLGYREALAEAGISIDAVPMVEALPGAGTGPEGARLLLDAAPEATAIVTMADTLAFAVLAEARARGIRVPDDLSVIGFDDLPDAATSDPPLTTMHQPIYDKGRQAALFIFHPPEATRHESMAARLVVRGSTAPPPR